MRHAVTRESPGWSCYESVVAEKTPRAKNKQKNVNFDFYQTQICKETDN